MIDNTILGVVISLLAEDHQQTIHQDRIGRDPGLALALGPGMSSHSRGRGWLTRARRPLCRGAGVALLPGCLGLLPNLHALLNMSLAP